MDWIILFNTKTQFYIFLVVYVSFWISETTIGIYSSTHKGSKGEIKQADKGTKIIVILGIFFSAFICVWFRIFQPTTSIMLPAFFFYIGLIITILGILIRSYAVWTLKDAFTLSIQTKKEQKLVTNGIYKFVRNPSYTGSIFSMLGFAIIIRSCISPFVVVLILVITYSIRIKVEEEAMRERFGCEFECYCKKSYKLFPYLY